MKLDKNMITLIEGLRPEARKRLGEYHNHLDDVVQECYVKLLEATIDESDNPEGFARRTLMNTAANFVRDERNRRKLESENAETIVKNSTPTLSGSITGGPEDFVASEQELIRRWKTMSPLLQRVAKRSFFGYTEAAEKVAEEFGMTVAAVNMARTRIKQHMNGANE